MVNLYKEQFSQSEWIDRTFVLETSSCHGFKKSLDLTTFQNKTSIVIPKGRRYQAEYNRFVHWCTIQNIESYTEDVILRYFEEMSQTYSCSSLWVFYSMLKCTLLRYHNVSMETFTKLRSFLKGIARDPHSKKYKSFTDEEFERFLVEAPDSTYLATKVALILGRVGRCRRGQLRALTVEDFQDFGKAMLVNVPADDKTKFPRQFTVTGHHYEYCKMYTDLRPNNASSNAFFLNYQNGRCTVQNIGVNKLGTMVKQVAQFLNVSEPELYRFF